MADDPRALDRDGITVLSADDPNRVPLNFTMREYLGSEIYRPQHTDEPLTSRDDIKAGDKIWVPSMWREGYYEMTVIESEGGGKLYAEDEKLLTCLEFAGDDRGAWCAVGYINKRGLKRLTTGLKLDPTNE